MGGLFGGAKPQAQQQPSVSGLQLQTSAYGKVVPLVYGTTRLAPNLGWYGDFQSISHQSSPPSSGKGGVVGGGGKGGDNVSTTYQAAVALMLCEGPVQGVGQAWTSKQRTTPAALGLSVFTGSYPQTPWGYLTTNHPAQALGYSGIAFLAAAPYQLGDSAQLPNHSFEVQGAYASSVGSLPDADPSLVIADFLTDAHHGAGFPTARLGTMTTCTETHAVPGSAPFTVTVVQGAGFKQNLDVVDGGGTVYACAAGSPGPQQYSVTPGGVYTFNAVQAGATLTFCYAALGGLTSYQNYALATGLLISPAYAEQRPAGDILTEIATATNAAYVWSSGALTLVPYGDQTVTGNGRTYTPPGAPLYDLTDDDFLGGAGHDPVQLTRKRSSDALNALKLEFLNRANQYNPEIVEAKDQAMIDVFGLRSNGSTQAHLFADPTAARQSAQLQLQRQAVRNVYTFALDWRYCLLDPMDLVTITDPGLGLDRQWVRITEIQEDGAGTLTITAEEYLGGSGAAQLYGFQQGGGYAANYNADPGNALAPIIFEAPVQIATSGLEIWLATAGGTLWGGCDVYVSSDGNTYKLAGRKNGPSRMGVLSALLPGGSDPDTADALSVDLTASLGMLLSGTRADADLAHTLCWVDGEFVSYQNATLTAPYKYTLGTYLRRGQFGSGMAAHASASKFTRLDGGIFKLPYDKSQIGSTVHLKLCSFNLWGGGQQQLSSVSDYTHVIVGPTPPGAIQGFSAQQNGNAVSLSWQDLPDYALKGYDILYGPQGGSLANAILVTEASRQTAETTVSIPPGNWTIYIRGHDVADQLGPAASANLTVSNTNTVIASVSSAPDWLGPLNGFVKHWTGVLVPDSTLLASAHTNAQLFEQFAPFPVANSTYTPAALDTQFNDVVRVFSQISPVTGRGLTGQAVAGMNAKTWLNGQVEPGVFTPWTIGSALLRYFRGQLVENTAVPAWIANFVLIADAPSLTESAASVAVGAGGTTITYAALGVGPFHTPPNIQCTPADGVLTSGGASVITTTTALIQGFVGATLTAGTLNLTFTGE